MRSLLHTAYATGIGLMLVLPICVSADEERTHKENLKRTEQRLNQLIKIAADQNLVHVSGPDTKQAQLPKSSPIPASSKTCISNQLFSFPPETRLHTYEDVLALKNNMVTGPDTIDLGKARTLALAYLGFGFGQEAFAATAPLESQEKLVISAMAKTLLGRAEARDIELLNAQSGCSEGAKTWLHLAGNDDVPLSGYDIKYIESLPGALKNIAGQKLGTRAVQNRDLKTAQSLYKILLAAAPKNADTNEPILGHGLVFFRALLALEDEDEHNRAAAMQTLKLYAKNDSPYQAAALQALSPFMARGEETYPGYIQDLESAAQTYGDAPQGKQANAQKINYFAQNQSFRQAIDLTWGHYELGDAYFVDSVIVISRHLQADLLGHNQRQQITALNILISDAEFFSHLQDDKTLKQAGIYACAQLGLPELAGQVSPREQWKNLNAETMNALALSYGYELKTQKNAAYFPQYVFEQAEFKVGEIKQALAQKNPKRAFAIKMEFPNNDVIQGVFVTSSWKNGYWSLVANNISEPSKASPGVGGELSLVEKKLAATLSVATPILIASNRPYGLDDLTALQRHLENELGVFQSYLALVQAPASGENSG